MALDLTEKQTSIQSWGSFPSDLPSNAAERSYPLLSDTHQLLGTVIRLWNECFAAHLDLASRALVYEIKKWRNDWAHQHIYPIALALCSIFA